MPSSGARLHGVKLRALSVLTVAVAVPVLGACASEQTTPVEFDDVPVELPNDSAPTGDSEASGEIPSSSAVGSESSDSQDAGEGALSPEEQNAESSRLAREYAEQQCLDDPDLEVGVIQIVHEETEETVARIEADCDEVRSRRGTDSE